MTALWLAFVACALVTVGGAFAESRRTVLWALTLLCIIAAAISTLEVLA